MKQLEKLVTKKVTSPESIKGGLYQLSMEMADDQERTTQSSATWNGQHYVTDCRNDPK
ncbi:hypothetical protein [Chitinophaga varians]|uniref:hypothetical protein n=1 Tax=Chitinophaga varians TaxID=2202339 RepID=UPI00165FCC24|nr:hypothetical protein [Chitinophaga varians]MBC9909905.1 hypothetical protein [Chitinophaga varians]